jgi:hypothetical protein
MTKNLVYSFKVSLLFSHVFPILFSSLSASEWIQEKEGRWILGEALGCF